MPSRTAAAWRRPARRRATSRAPGCATRAPAIAPCDAGEAATAVAVGAHARVSRSRPPGRKPARNRYPPSERGSLVSRQDAQPGDRWARSDRRPRAADLRARSARHHPRVQPAVRAPDRDLTQRRRGPAGWTCSRPTITAAGSITSSGRARRCSGSSCRSPAASPADRAMRRERMRSRAGARDLPVFRLRIRRSLTARDGARYGHGSDHGTSRPYMSRS